MKPPFWVLFMKPMGFRGLLIVNLNKMNKIGKFGEDVACVFLKKHGYKIVERNYLKKWGELDIVAKKAGKLCFVEVKTVLINRGFDPVEQMTHRKLSHLQNAINDYLAYYRVPPDQSYRLDYIGIIVDSANQVLKFDHRSSIGLSG